MHIKLVFWLALLLAAFSPPASAHGYDSLIRKDLTVASDLPASIFAKSQDGGLWAIVETTFARHQLVKLSPSGTREFGLFLPTNSFRRTQLSLYPLSDGGVLELDAAGRSGDNSFCSLKKISSQGVVVFTRRINLASCTLKLSMPGKAPYLVYAENEAELLAEDGSTITRFELEFSLVDVEFADNRRDLLFLSKVGISGYRLIRQNAFGLQLWSTLIEGVSQDINNVAIRVLGDDKIMVVSISEIGLLQSFYSQAGQLISTKNIPLPGSLRIRRLYTWAQDEQGNLGLATEFIDRNAESIGELIFSSTGNLNKSVSYPSAEACADVCQLIGLASGFARTIRNPTRRALVIISADANVADVIREISFEGFANVANGNNSTILVPDRGVAGKPRAFTLTGAEITPPDLTGKVFTEPDVVAAATAENGTRYVFTYSNQVVEGARSTVRSITAFAPDGAVAWKNDALATFQGAVTMIADSRRVCIHIASFGVFSGFKTLTCHSSQNGLEISSLRFPGAGSGVEGRPMHLLSDGRLRFVTTDVTSGGNSRISLRVVDISTNNDVTEFLVPMDKTISVADVGSNGTVLLTQIDNTSTAAKWILLTPAGAIAWQRDLLTPIASFRVNGRILSNGHVVLIAPRENSESAAKVVSYFDANGSLLWSTSLPIFTGSNDSGVIRSISIDAMHLYISRTDVTSIVGTPPVRSRLLRVQAVSLSDGQIVWTRDLRRPWIASTALFSALNSREILVTNTNNLGLNFNRLDPSNGTILESRMLGCGSENCQTLNVSIDPTGELRSISVVNDSGRGSLVLGSTSTRNIAPEISLTQLGIGGAWYTPQLSGQGMFVEYFPANNVLFAPWFTFTDDDAENSPASPNSSSVANLRWYSLTGVLVPGAKEAKLEIRRNIAGIFDSLPTTASSVVGQATLRAQDCNLATLEFEFNAGEAERKYGVLPLTRLTGGSASCQLSTAQTIPGRDARPARGGFDSRQSGAWYEPQTSGQGFMLTVQPATASATGAFFGGWFTYDAGAPNDETAQHWLTLSGDIRPDAPAGVIPVIIYRTLGGRLAEVQTRNTAELGRGSVTFNGCGNAIFRYQFDDGLIVGSFRGKSGEIPLQRLGACPAE